MSFDPVKAFIDQKRTYAETRGTGQGGGGTGYYPLTTTMDAFVFSRSFFRETQKTEDGILERGSQALASVFGAGPTRSYENAVKAWKATWPSVIEAMVKPTAPWWDNQRFWAYGSQYSIARSAIGSVPGHWEMLKDSVEEVAKDRFNDIVGLVDWSKWLGYGLLGYIGYRAIR